MLLVSLALVSASMPMLANDIQRMELNVTVNDEY
jgi:hypothetical protein